MSKYTIELRRLCEMAGREEVESWFKDYDLSEFLTREQLDVIEGQNVWSKDKLATQIVNHFMMREIGSETPGLFAFYAKNIMREIMEAKAPIIYSLALQFNPLDGTKINETVTRNTKGQSESTTTGKTSGLSIRSDTPMGQIDKSEILNGKYASSTDGSESDSNAKDNSSSNTTEHYERTLSGRDGKNSPLKLIAEFRENIIAINRDIIKELDVLFMGIY